MTHDFDHRSMFCTVCNMPLRAVAEHPDLDLCTPENATRWKAIEAARIARIERDAALSAESRKIDAQPLPTGTTFGDLRRAMGFDRWPS